MDLRGRVSLVTGSTTGIGQASARALAKAGSSVMVHGRREDRGAAVVDELRSLGVEADLMLGDVADAAFCQSLVDGCVERFGRIDVLVNNAGILPEGSAPDTDDEAWLRCMQVNVNAVFFLSRAAVHHMRDQGSGNIINISSEWGLNGEQGFVAYCTSKGALMQMTRCMALDHAQEGIRVNAVCPGEIHTEMVDNWLASEGGDPGDNLAKLASGIPMRRVAQPDEVAACVLFLASDASSYVTGSGLSVDGGNAATGGPYPG
ncbi:MAG: SDR family NAD(P)-dependent oxidoreductase [Miltoncostaeaceae bacterium]